MAQGSQGKRRSTYCSLASVLLIWSGCAANAQQTTDAPVPPTAPPADEWASVSRPGPSFGQLLQVPVNTFVPGAVPAGAQITIPALNDPAAPQRGMTAFAAFNCVGCHMGNGGGGMGPSLSDGNFIYGGNPENLYLTIVQGRPSGMPAWGRCCRARPSGIWSLTSATSAKHRSHSGELRSRPVFQRSSRCLRSTRKRRTHGSRRSLSKTDKSHSGRTRMERCCLS